jgi:hypothetical protein
LTEWENESGPSDVILQVEMWRTFGTVYVWIDCIASPVTLMVLTMRFMKGEEKKRERSKFGSRTTITLAIKMPT